MNQRLILLFILITSSCVQDNNDFDCEELSMKYYRGLPKESHQYVKYCKDKEATLKYTPTVCKNALGSLMLTGSLKLVKEKYGKRITECFNQVDIERFSKQEPE